MESLLSLGQIFCLLSPVLQSTNFDKPFDFLSMLLLFIRRPHSTKCVAFFKVALFCRELKDLAEALKKDSDESSLERKLDRLQRQVSLGLNSFTPFSIF